MIKEFIEVFRRPSVAMLMQRELEEAKRSLLEAQTGAEYAQRMAQYHGDRIARLSHLMKEPT